MDPEKTRILLVEDNLGDARLIRGMLAEQGPNKYEVTHVGRLSEAFEQLKTEKFDVILLDLTLPDSQGLETVRTVLNAVQDIPVVAVSGLDDEEAELAAVQAGAQDYVVKGLVNGRAMARATRNAIERHRLKRKLETASRDLMQKTQEIQNFYHSVSHELRTPLTAAREFVAIVLDGLGGPVTATQREYLGLAKSSCDHLRRCINDLVDSSRLETAKLEISAKHLDLGSVVGRVVASMMPSAQSKRIRLQTSITPLLPSIPFDEQRITQVLMNLLTNALKFTPESGAVTVTVREELGNLLVEVADTGPGISPADSCRVFDRLYQVQRNEGTEENGLGLGLFISREIIKLHGGVIRVDSEVGKGSTFSFTLPKAGRRTKALVLIVDDEEMIRNALRTTLDLAGFAVQTAASGNEALDLLHQEVPDLILLDLMMPGMDGPTAFREIQKGWGPIPIVILTGYPQSDLVKRALECSPITLLSKPWVPDHLLETVRNATTRPRTESVVA